MPKLSFASDYMEGAHPAILKRLAETNLLQSAGYGTDEFSEAAREKVRTACNAPEADVFFLVGGTMRLSSMRFLSLIRAFSHPKAPTSTCTKPARSNSAATA